MTRNEWVKIPQEKRRRWAAEHPLAWILEYRPTILLPGSGVIPLEPYDFQISYLKDQSQYRIVNKARQIGLTTIAAAEVAFFASRGKADRIVILSKSDGAAEEFLEYVKQIISSVQKTDPDFVPVQGKMTAKRIRFKDGSRIVSIAPSSETGRSISASRIYFDECAFTPFVDSVFQAIEPTISKTNGQMTIFSTPKGRANLFARICKNPIEQGFSYHQYEWWQCPEYNPYYSKWKKDGDPKWIEKAKQSDWYKSKRAKHTALSFAQEFECSFDADIDSVYSQKQLDNVFRRNYLPEKFDPAMPFITEWFGIDKIEGHNYATGVDFGRKRDATVLITYDITERPAKVVDFKRIAPGDGDWADILLTVRNTYDYFKSDVRADATGIGDVIFEEIADIAEPVIISASGSNKGKYNLIENTRRAYDKRAVIMPRIEQLYSEHEKYQWNDKNLVQDCIMANAIAISAFYDPETEGMFVGVDTNFNYVEA